VLLGGVFVWDAWIDCFGRFSFIAEKLSASQKNLGEREVFFSQTGVFWICHWERKIIWSKIIDFFILDWREIPIRLVFCIWYKQTPRRHGRIRGFERLLHTAVGKDLIWEIYVIWGVIVFLSFSIWSVFFLRRPPGRLLGPKSRFRKETDTIDGERVGMMVPLVMEKHMSPNQITITFSTPYFHPRCAFKGRVNTLAHSWIFFLLLSFIDLFHMGNFRWHRADGGYSFYLGVFSIKGVKGGKQNIFWPGSIGKKSFGHLLFMVVPHEATRYGWSSKS